ncbi:MAG TPA: pilus assembly protein N-terminal domain-containing protein [Terriglobales bacterium]|nr:pilus assembly protein N-terminal domain-containing protein [Terriglobales bacterium]
MNFHHRWTTFAGILVLLVVAGVKNPRLAAASGGQSPQTAAAQSLSAQTPALQAPAPQTPAPQQPPAQQPPSAPAPAPPAPSPQAAEGSQEAPNELTVTVGKSLIVSTAQPIERISVGYNDVAEATAVSPREVLVNGKATGETSLIVWEQGGNKLFFDLLVQPNTFVNTARLEAVRRELRKELPGDKINLSYENDTVFVRGTVKDLTSSDRALAIASTLGKTVNLLYVTVPEPEKQVLLKVRFASIDRNAAQQLGLTLISTGATNTVGSIGTGQFGPPSGTATGSQSTSSRGVLSGSLNLSDAVQIFLARPDLNLATAIEALETRGLTEILAEPNVLAINGRLASFLAGGEFPYPTLQGGGFGLGAVTVAFREFGVRINFIPTITPRGTIRLDLAPEVSALDFGNSLTLSGFVIPGLSVRRVRTNIELSSGQSFVITGLLDRRLTETIDKIPLLGDIPLLGKIFQSRSLTKNNTELLVIVTPELVRPIPAGQALTELSYPKALMDPTTHKPMRTPGIETTGPVPVTPPEEAIPIEQMMKSLTFPRLEQAQGIGGSGLQDTTFQPAQLTPPNAAPAPAPAAPPK